MPNIKAVVIRRPTPFDGSGNTAYITGMTNRIMTTPKRVNVVQEGLRASDNMSMTLSAEHDVQQNDEIYYIQDFLDTSSLKAVWNFYGGFRDESGYEHDDVLDSNDEHVMPNCVDSTVSSETDMDSRYKGYYKFKINALSSSKTSVEIIKQFKNNNTTSSKIPVMDMSGDFDMIFHFKSLTNSSSYNNMCIFHNYDNAASGGTGLKVNINSQSNTITITADKGKEATKNIVDVINSTQKIVILGNNLTKESVIDDFVNVSLIAEGDEGTFTMGGSLQVNGVANFNSRVVYNYQDIEAGDSGAAVALSTSLTVSFVTTDTNKTHVSLADGTSAGQIKYIIHKARNNESLVITPASFAAGSLMTSDSAGRGITLIFDGANWQVLGDVVEFAIT